MCCVNLLLISWPCTVGAGGIILKKLFYSDIIVVNFSELPLEWPRICYWIHEIMESSEKFKAF